MRVWVDWSIACDVARPIAPFLLPVCTIPGAIRGHTSAAMPRAGSSSERNINQIRDMPRLAHDREFVNQSRC
jgi:hypothetical protein